MIQVIFDGMFSWDDLGLFLTENVNVPPVPKRKTVDVPFSNGLIDITKGITEKTYYSNGQRTLTFAMKNYDHDWENIFAELRKKLHGKYMKVTVDENTGYYHEAYVTITSNDAKGNMGTVVINLDYKPYMLKSHETISTVTMDGSWVTASCRNADPMDVIPVFTSTGTFTAQFNGKNITFDGAGDHESADIVFGQGLNTVKLKGNSGVNVTIHYREGRI